MAFNTILVHGMITDTLAFYDGRLAAPEAVQLLMGTSAVESDFGTWLRQLGGPAVSMYMYELPTFNWIKDVYKDTYPIGDWQFDDLVHDHWKATLMARLRYRVVPEPLPALGDIDQMARYWKEHYNTYLGRGTIEDFIHKYGVYVDV